MKLTSGILLITLLLFFHSLFGQNQQELEKIDFPKISEIQSFDDAKQISEAILLHLIHTRHTPAVSITVTQGGNTVWQKGYGLADIENKIEVNPRETLFRIASVSKPISAVGLTKMQQQGKINWDKSIYEYVPNFPKKKHDITIKQLAGHLSGIRTYKKEEVFNNEPLSISDGIHFFANDKLSFKPGKRYYYTSYNWNLVSLAMQNAAKIPFEVYMKKEVFNPLGMKNTLPDRGGLTTNQAIPYSGGKGKSDFHKATDVNNFFKLAGGGYLSTSEDLAKLGNAILHHDLLDKKYQEKMLTSQQTNGGKKTGYGIGWKVGKDWKKRTCYGHIGNGIGGFAWFYVYPEEEVVIAMLFNITNPNFGGNLRKIVDYILEGLKNYQVSTKERKVNHSYPSEQNKFIKNSQ